MARGIKRETRQFNFLALVTRKICTKCNIEKDAGGFGRKAKSSDGLRDWCNECGTDYQKQYYHSDLEANRKRKREWMAKERTDPTKRQMMNERTKASYYLRRESIRATGRAKYKRRFFWARAMKLRGISRASTGDISLLWKAQRGKCALTGVRLDRSAQLDHKLPKALGGGDEISNLQWTCAAVNYAKRDLTQDDFVKLCDSVIRWIGRRVMEAAQ